MRIKPQNYKGTRDFLPLEIARRKYLFSHIANVFEQFGFQEIQTPAIERIETLTGKYGLEGDKLLFKILNSGDYLSKVGDDVLAQKDSRKATASLTEKGLRYDLTVPLARYVVQHQNKLVFPFKRYHVGLVWRADRPQKGRYREFFQCDADIIGSNGLLSEIELTSIFLQVFDSLQIDVVVRINNRKILNGLLASLGLEDRISEFLVILDKYDKIGKEKVIIELQNNNFTDAHINTLVAFIESETLADLNIDSEEGKQGIQEVLEIQNLLQNANVVFDPTLARGLDYYTGVIWEVNATNSSIKSSIASGGRYENLTEMFGGRNMSGVGISFGVERIYDIMMEQELFPASVEHKTRVLFVNFGAENQSTIFQLAHTCRAKGLRVEVYPDAVKMGKQMKYANEKGIRYVVIQGADEINNGTLVIKNMENGEQSTIHGAALLDILS